MTVGGVEVVGLEHLDERYAALRLVRPRQEQAITDSMARLGQIAPLVGCRRGEHLAIVDGFKRLRAARQLALSTLSVRLLPLSEQAAVASVYSLNRHGAGLLDLEEAFVVRTLVREQGLAQNEVAELLDRHPSWVSRRLALVERLDDKVQDDVRVGLLSCTAAREIVRLPRGNQVEVATAVRRAGLSSRDATRLVDLFGKATDRDQQRVLLDGPREVLERQAGGTNTPPWDVRLGPETNRLRRSVLIAASSVQRAVSELAQAQPTGWSEPERTVLAPMLHDLQTTTNDLERRLTGLVAIL